MWGDELEEEEEEDDDDAAIPDSKQTDDSPHDVQATNPTALTSQASYNIEKDAHISQYPTTAPTSLADEEKNKWNKCYNSQ